MTKDQINAVLDRVRSWPEEDQEKLIEVAHEIEAQRKGLYHVSDAEREGIERGLKAVREDRFASEERIADIFRKARSTRP
jgi:hypothetical protein